MCTCLNMATSNWWSVAILLSAIKACVADRCYYGYAYYYGLYSSYYYSGYSYYCDQGCCGYYYSRYCCTSLSWIAGAVIGGIIAVAFIVMVIACICKQKYYKGRVIGPVRTNQGQTNTVHIVHQPPPGQQMQYQQPQPGLAPPPYMGGAGGYQQPGQQPSYPPVAPPGYPPAQDPAYPPPPPKY